MCVRVRVCVCVLVCVGKLSVCESMQILFYLENMFYIGIASAFVALKCLLYTLMLQSLWNVLFVHGSLVFALECLLDDLFD